MTTHASNEKLNIDQSEVNKFEAVASRWWDPHSEFKPLHDINPLRLEYVERNAGVKGRRIADIGCGGGILAESMAARGGDVLGIDAGGAPISVARLHALESNIKVEYRQCTAEQLAAEQPESFEIVTCMEMLEHVPDPASVVQACARLVKPGGHVFFSTLNRTPKSYLFAVLGAEYVLQMLPKGTHDYRKFIRPAELEAWARHAGLTFQNLSGMSYNPLTRHYSLGAGVDVNYLVHATRSAT
ncbi:MAG: bifunctional 2-polyprenyl-6-hydroxyphenol methylase/3-demethylubiquinol 3-O-methyltransferase UbiG [Gammaproteobacteria bacterium]|nr:bifunctional 2-polyprenyl-6-hydroxyphenol methylase/3-demethylubiquinol 3-O-methyltransferase UbiG [Gammaproteobacteria bacterium]